MTAVQNTVKFVRASGRAWSRKWSFLGVFLAVFFVSFSTLAAFDLVPETPEKVVEADVPTRALSASVALAAPENATRVVVEKIDLDVVVKNPMSTNVAVLDEALLTGAVRYPTSAKLGEEGNVILFGHSSYLPIVNNEAFKAFNEIQHLEKGDRITVYGETAAFVYAVTDVASADADEAAIPLTAKGHTLTLATCDSFGKKTARFIVTAELVETYPLGS